MYTLAYTCYINVHQHGYIQSVHVLLQPATHTHLHFCACLSLNANAVRRNKTIETILCTVHDCTRHTYKTHTHKHLNTHTCHTLTTTCSNCCSRLSVRAFAPTSLLLVKVLRSRKIAKVNFDFCSSKRDCLANLWPNGARTHVALRSGFNRRICSWLAVLAKCILEIYTWNGMKAKE